MGLITTRQQWNNSNTGLYGSWELRQMNEGGRGPGCADYNSFRVLPRQLGVNMSVDCGVAPARRMQAWIASSTREGLGLWRVENADYSQPVTTTYLPQLNEVVTANATGSPRLDQVVLRVADSSHAGGSNGTFLEVVAGTATAGATLDNRSGAAVLPAGTLLLADVLVPPSAASIGAGAIRDRRPCAVPGSIPWGHLTPASDMVTLVPHPAIVRSGTTGGNLQLLTLAASQFDGYNFGALCALPRRIVGANQMRFNWLQSAVPSTAAFDLGIYDASGRKIVTFGGTTFGGAANSYTAAIVGIPATTFEAGSYWVVFGQQFAQAAGQVNTHDAMSPKQAACYGVTCFAQNGNVLPATMAGFSDGQSYGNSFPPGAIPVLSLVAA